MTTSEDSNAPNETPKPTTNPSKNPTNAVEGGSNDSNVEEVPPVVNGNELMMKMVNETNGEALGDVLPSLLAQSIIQNASMGIPPPDDTTHEHNKSNLVIDTTEEALRPSYIVQNNAMFSRGIAIREATDAAINTAPHNIPLELLPGILGLPMQQTNASLPPLNAAPQQQPRTSHRSHLLEPDPLQDHLSYYKYLSHRHGALYESLVRTNEEIAELQDKYLSYSNHIFKSQEGYVKANFQVKENAIPQAKWRLFTIGAPGYREMSLNEDFVSGATGKRSREDEEETGRWRKRKRK